MSEPTTRPGKGVVMRALVALLLLLGITTAGQVVTSSPAAAWGREDAGVTVEDDCDGYTVTRWSNYDPANWTSSGDPLTGTWSDSVTSASGTETVSWPGDPNAGPFNYDWSASKPGDCTPPPVDCPDGTQVPSGQECPPVQCPDGTTVPNGEDCPPPPPAPDFSSDCVDYEFILVADVGPIVYDGPEDSGTLQTGESVVLNGDFVEVYGPTADPENFLGTANRPEGCTPPPPPPVCPEGTDFAGTPISELDDVNNDGQVNEGDCNEPPPPPNNHPECVDYKDLQPGETTPVYGEVWIKSGSEGPNHGHYSVGVQPAGYVIPDTIVIDGKERDVSHADVCEMEPPPPAPDYSSDCVEYEWIVKATTGPIVIDGPEDQVTLQTGESHVMIGDVADIYGPTADPENFLGTANRPEGCTPPPPPPVCPEGTDHAGTPISELDDVNGDGTVDAKDCDNPPSPPVEDFTSGCVNNVDWVIANTGETDLVIQLTEGPGAQVGIAPGSTYTVAAGLNTVWVGSDLEKVTRPAGCEPTVPPPPVVDVCPNIDGNQPTVPDGLVKDAAGNCVTPPPPPVDECPDMPGNQPSKDECPPPPVDVCPNIDGPQSSVPAGMVKDAAGNCVNPTPAGSLPVTSGSTSNPMMTYVYIGLLAALALFVAPSAWRRLRTVKV